MKSKHKKKPETLKRIALERIEKLFEEASKVFKKNYKLSDRYVFLARKIGMRYKTRIPSALKKMYCKHCLSFLMPSVNARVRLQKSKIVYYCLACKKYMRFPYIREKKGRRMLKRNIYAGKQ